ncbi:MAG: right-handed parallel beta-helix repeat-containing protein [Planctomycetales bacterium]|nr:right-handed parallel beta-helix repeat-containing protein [Planctomycetales bacterium]
MLRQAALLLISLAVVRSVTAAIIEVPRDSSTLQAALDASQPGDTILVAPGTYRERIRLKAGVILRSVGNASSGADGLARAEVTIIDGGGDGVAQAGVLMAEGSVLDGFTVTNVGMYNESIWMKHFESNGEDLGDDEGSVQAEGTTAAISIRGVSCTVTNCVVHHNGDVGIGILGEVGASTAPLITSNIVYRNMGGGIGVAERADPVIRDNRCSENLRAGIGCRNADPIIANNLCFQNIRAGIGCREGSRPVMRGNKCYRNRRAGIGIRMEGTEPIVEHNECYENEMAGIGCRNGARPILRNNVCRDNKMAGIGCQQGAKPLIVGNESRNNAMAGIGLEGKSSALIDGNTCIDNKLVAIGVTGESSATIIDNTLSRTGGGAPPLVAVKDGSTATLADNHITGGGVAAVLVQGNASIGGNTFTGLGNKQGNAVWVREDSMVTISDNSFSGYRTAINAKKASVAITSNSVKEFQGTAIKLTEIRTPVLVYGNTAISSDPNAKAVELQGSPGSTQSDSSRSAVIELNVMKHEPSIGENRDSQ